MNEVSDLLSFDLWYQICLISPESFSAVRSINKNIYYYTQKNIQKYKNRFSTTTTIYKNLRIITYEKLPDGNKNGYYRKSIQGHIIKECSYRDGKLHGPLQRFYESGSKKTQCKYVDGNKHGIYKKFYENGNISYIVNYDHGRRDGLRQTFTKTGDIIKSCYYYKGRKHGLYQEWALGGVINKRCTYFNGLKNGLSKKFVWYGHGRLFTQCNFVNGHIEGCKITWFEFGKEKSSVSISESNYVDGVKEGISQSWHLNHKHHLSHKAHYKNGSLDGLYQKWYSNGQIYKQSIYCDGLLHGSYQKWHANGQLSKQCNFTNGFLHGSYKKWFNDGRLKEEIYYNNGVGKRIK